MSVKYFKRYRMEVDLRRTETPGAEVPESYEWVAWHPTTMDEHARVKYLSFVDEIDSEIFPAFRGEDGCRRLMQDIATHQGFAPRATWLLRHTANEFAGRPGVGTVQGLVQGTGVGSIQNVGVVPEHRGMKLGRALVLKALAGFRSLGLSRVYLEVTATNTRAVLLYHSLGFRLVRTSYRETIPREVIGA